MPIEPIEINFAEYLPEISGRPVSEIMKPLLAGECEPEKIDLIMRYVVKSGYRLSASELRLLRAPLQRVYPQIKNRGSFAFHLALCSYIFEMPEIRVIGDKTVAFAMASRGHLFSPEEIRLLGNPKDEVGRTIDQFYISVNWPRSYPNFGGVGKLYFRRDSEPSFDPEIYSNIVQKGGQGFTVEFGFYSNLSDRFHSINDFRISIHHSGSGWEAHLTDGGVFDSFHLLYQKILLMELVKRINFAIVQQQSFDFSDYLIAIHQESRPDEIEVYG